MLLRIVKSKSWNDLSNPLIFCRRELRARELKGCMLDHIPVLRSPGSN